MFSNIDYHNLSLWINKNATDYLDNLKRVDSLKNKKEKILKLLMSFDNHKSDYRKRLINFIIKLTNTDDSYLAFSAEHFFNIDSLEDQVYYLLTRLDTLSSSARLAFIDGLFMYVVQEQDIPMATLLYLYIDQDNEFSRDFLEFLKFEQNIDGSIGIVNPLRDKDINSDELDEWLLLNSLYVYMILPLVNSTFKKD